MYQGNLFGAAPAPAGLFGPPANNFVQQAQPAGYSLFGGPAPVQPREQPRVATAAPPQVDARPAQGGIDESIIDTMDTDGPFSCQVCYNEYSSAEKHKSRRPYSYDCGHTTCLGCIEKNTRDNGQGKKCPFCSKPSRQTVRNFGLEDAVTWAKELQKGGSDESSLYKNQSLCLTCMETFDPNIKLLFGNTHADHEVVPLRDKDPKLMKKIFWVLNFIKNQGTLNMDRAETLLAMLLNFADHYMEALFFVQSVIQKSKKDNIDSLLKDVKLFMKNETNPAKYSHKKLLDSLLVVRELEVEKAHAIFNLAKDSRLPFSDMLDNEFFGELKKDQESFVPLGMHDKYIGVFPLLTSLQPDPEESGNTSFCQNWFHTWYSARTRTKSC